MMIIMVENSKVVLPYCITFKDNSWWPKEDKN